MNEQIKVLLVEDDKIDQLAFSRFVQREGLPYDMVIAGSIQDARSILATQNFDIILIDYFLGGDTALDLLEKVHDTPTIVITGLGDEEIAVKAMKLGASDYLTKDADGNYLKILPPVVTNAIKLKLAENELIHYRDNLEKMVVERTGELDLANQQLRQEITERKQAEAQVLLQATALESAVNGIMIIDKDGKINWANSALVKMTGYSLDELIGKSPMFIRKVSPDDGEYEKLWRAVKKGIPWHGEVSNMRKDGDEFIAEMTITPVTNEMGKVTHYISICNDISEKIRAREKLKYLATHDTLTDLPNRLLFSDRLTHALAMANRTDSQGAVLLIDMDDFKAINDAFSHDDGDEFLKIMAGRFNECLRESDTVARIGGDEFAILLENIDPEDTGLVAQKINRVLSKPVEIRGNIIISTASIGISIFPQDGDAIQTLLKNADLAMYRAKEDKNSFQPYTPEMGAMVKEQMELTTYLRYALQNDIFQLHYQPQVNAETGRVIGMEALLRLPHPKKKWISPNDFIPLAEKTGLITSIDEWVLRAAVKKMKGLLDSGFREITMSVNISSRQLGQSNLYNILDTILKENNLDPGFLELEISENSVFQNMKNAITTLSKLKAMGLKLAIDDFGTGYASLNYLANFPLNTLKIDLSFTKKILSSKGDAAIVTGVIAIANSLGLDIIVEGVEEIEQLGFFLDLGCHLIQGYFYSPAVPGNEINNLLNTGFAQR